MLFNRFEYAFIHPFVQLVRFAGRRVYRDSLFERQASRGLYLVVGVARDGLSLLIDCYPFVI